MPVSVSGPCYYSTFSELSLKPKYILLPQYLDVYSKNFKHEIQNKTLVELHFIRQLHNLTLCVYDKRRKGSMCNT